MLPDPEFIPLEIAPANSNLAVSREDALFALDKFLRGRMGKRVGEKDLAIGGVLERHIETIRAADPSYALTGDMLEKLCFAYLSDIADFPVVWCGYITDIYQAANPAFFMNGDFRTRVGDDVKAHLQADIKSAGYDFLYAYIDSAHSLMEKVGMDTAGDAYKQELAGLLCDRLESDLSKGNVIGVDDMIFDINRTLGLNELTIDPEHRIALAALVTSNGLSLLEKSFTDSAVPGAPPNAKILQSTVRGLSQLGIEGSGLDGVRNTLEESFVRAAVREGEMKARLQAEREESARPSPGHSWV